MIYNIAIDGPAGAGKSIQADPKENHNLYGDKAYQNVIDKMKKEMLRLREATGDTDAASARMQSILKAEGLK